jgi:hypothetical protein
MRFRFLWSAVLVLGSVLCGCTGYQPVRFPATRHALMGPESKQQTGLTQQKAVASPEISDWGWSERLITGELFHWTDAKTSVVIVDSLSSVKR